MREMIKPNEFIEMAVYGGAMFKRDRDEGRRGEEYDPTKIVVSDDGIFKRKSDHRVFIGQVDKVVRNTSDKRQIAKRLCVKPTPDGQLPRIEDVALVSTNPYGYVE